MTMECSQCFTEMASISVWILYFKLHSHLLVFLIASGPSQGLLTLSLHPGFTTTHLSWAFKMRLCASHLRRRKKPCPRLPSGSSSANDRFAVFWGHILLEEEQRPKLNLPSRSERGSFTVTPPPPSVRAPSSVPPGSSGRPTV